MSNDKNVPISSDSVVSLTAERERLKAVAQKTIEPRERSDYEELCEIILLQGMIVDRLDRLASRRGCTRAELFRGPKAIKP